MFLIIGIWGGEKVYSAFKFFIYSFWINIYVDINNLYIL